LGEHVPYPVEAWPEGNQRHLSAESALYCRVFTEGLFGIRPTGLRSFDCTPRLPDGWPTMALKNVHAFGGVFDLEISRADAGKINIRLRRDGKPDVLQTVVAGKTVKVEL
jgi:cellobiose phosphorylase